MAGAINFTAPNYHESQPFPIESELANTVATNPAAAGMALPLLMSYQAQRGEGQADYAKQIQDQHSMALNALMQNQAVNRQEQTISGLKVAADNPGVIGALLSNANTAPLYAGTDGASLNSINDNANRIALSKILADAGKGAQGLAAGGMQPSLPSVSGVTGLPMAPYTPPVAQAAALNAGGRVAAAGISANGGNGSVTMPLGPPGPNQPTVHLKGPAAQSVINSSGGIPGATSTNLPPAATQSSGGTPQAGGHITAQTLQAARVANPQAYGDIMAAAKATGGQVKVGPGGGLIGASGKEW
jgi:hypothetical protein